jgi:hypothetical protein
MMTVVVVVEEEVLFWMEFGGVLGAVRRRLTSTSC